MTQEKFLHVSKGTIHTLVDRDTEAKTVTLVDEEGNEATVKNVTLNRWYRPITKACGELYNRVYGDQPEVVEEVQPVQESLGLQIVEELQQIIDEVEEVPSEQPDEESRYIQLVEPDGTTTTYSYATNTWRQDLEIYPELAHKVPQGTVDNMPWFTPDNQFLGDDMRTSGDCLGEALNIPILANVLEQRECDGMELNELTVMEIVTEALHLLHLSKNPESQLYGILHSEGNTLQQHTANQLERMQEFVDRWMEVKF